MGYTNYFYTNEKSQFDLKKWNNVIDVFNKIYTNRLELFDTKTLRKIPNMQYYTELGHEDKLKIVQDFENQTKPPELTDELICFNGAGDFGHEAFFLERVPEHSDYKSNQNFNFTKTARKPYDFWVIGMLGIIKSIAPNNIKIGSDGGYEEINPILETFSQALNKLNINLENYPKDFNDLTLGFYENYQKYMEDQEKALRDSFLNTIDTKEYNLELDEACNATQNDYDIALQDINKVHNKINELNATLAGQHDADEHGLIDTIQSICDKYKFDVEDLISDIENKKSYTI